MRVPIDRCEAEVCAYNQNGNCYAVAIEIGKDGASCESFTRSVMFNVSPHFLSQVSSCRMSGCASNRLSSCTRETVAIDGTPKGGICGDFSSRDSEKKLNK
ncbi:MAG: DUF1540 domain-containing protein [Actinomycetota bacterium]